MEDSKKEITKKGQETATSTEAPRKQAVCKKHGPYQSAGIGILGSLAFEPCPRCMDEAEAMDVERKAKEQKERESTRLAGLFEKCGVPKRFRTKSIVEYQTPNEGAAKAKKQAIAYLEHFLTKVTDRGASLIFCGRPGTGKTHLACAIVMDAIFKYKCSAVYTTVFNAMQRIKASYRPGAFEDEATVIRFYSAAGLLVLDEVGVQHGTDFERVLFYQIVNSRYENVLPTIIVSNLTIKELPQYIDDRVIDRMREGGGGVIPFDWESCRK